MEDFKEKKEFYKNKINDTIEKFKSNGFAAKYFENSKEAVDYFFSQIDKNTLIGYGGSKTVMQLDIIEKLRNGNYNLLDRTKEGISSDEKAEIERRCFTADMFLASSNAVSKDGALVNIDMYNNRIAAMLFGPKKVFLFVGRNKICDNIDDAINRAKNKASVMNGIRFNTNPDDIQAAMSIIYKSAIKERINLIFINEDLGF